MKKSIFTLSLLILCSYLAIAQEASSFYSTPYKTRNSGSFQKDDYLLSVGYGAPNLSSTKYALPGGYLNNSYSGFGPFYAKLEKGIMDEVGVGLYNATAFFANQYKLGTQSYTDRGLALSFGLMGFYHFNKFIPVKQLDVYAGIGGAFRLLRYEYGNSLISDVSNTTVFPVAKVGARYYFSESIGAYAEVGHDNMSTANIGLSLRF